MHVYNFVVLTQFTEMEQVVREVQHSRNGVSVTTEDGFVYEASYVILSVSIGVLQSDLISFTPPLPVRLSPSCLFYVLYSLLPPLFFANAIKQISYFWNYAKIDASQF